MKWAGIIVPILCSVAGYFLVPIGLWIELNQGLLAFLGLLAAALVQVIPVTANFLQSDRLTPVEAERLSAQLSKQQRYWVGLLVSVVVTFVVVVVVSILKDRTQLPLGRFGTADIGPTFSAVVTFALTFVLIKMTAIVSGVMSLQHLRNELVLNGAKRAAAEQVQKAQAELQVPPNLVPSDYGRIIQPH
jgi:hypothetical protein